MKLAVLLSALGMVAAAQPLDVCSALASSHDGQQVTIHGYYNPQGSWPRGFPRIDAATPSCDGLLPLIPMYFVSAAGVQLTENQLRANQQFLDSLKPADMDRPISITVSGIMLRTRTWRWWRFVDKYLTYVDDLYRTYPAFIVVKSIQGASR